MFGLGTPKYLHPDVIASGEPRIHHSTGKAANIAAAVYAYARVRVPVFVYPWGLSIVQVRA